MTNTSLSIDAPSGRSKSHQESNTNRQWHTIKSTIEHKYEYEYEYKTTEFSSIAYGTDSSQIA